MQNKKRKGFTIVELVIVIAIVAVLAAVLIPTIGSLIKKANESADMQTVYQMNIIIAAESIEDGDLTIDEVLDILQNNGFDIENLEPSSEDLEFRWDEENRVVILVKPNADGDLEQIYPVVDGNGIINEDTVVKLERDPVNALKRILTVGGTLTLEESITLDETITVSAGKKVTLNLGEGVTLTVKSIENNGELNIFGGSLVITDDIQETEGDEVAVLTLAADEGNNYGILNSEEAILKLIDCNLSIIGEYTSVYEEVWDDYWWLSFPGSGIYNLGTITINSSNDTTAAINVTAENGIYNEGLLTVSGNASLNILGAFNKGVENRDGTVNIDNALITVTGTDAYGVYNYEYWSTPSTTLNNSTIAVEGNGAYGAYNYGIGTLILNDTSATITGYNAYGVSNYKGTVFINGGTFKAADENDYEIAASIKNLIHNDGGSTTLNGTSVIAKAAGYTADAPIYAQKGTISIVNSSISSNRYCTYTNSVSAASITRDGLSTFSYGSGCNINYCNCGAGEGCAHFTQVDGFEAQWGALGESGGAIALSGDIVINTELTVASGQTIIIDLNGHKLTLGSQTMFNIDGSLKIEDSVGGGSIYITASSFPFTINGGTLTISGKTDNNIAITGAYTSAYTKDDLFVNLVNACGSITDCTVASIGVNKEDDNVTISLNDKTVNMSTEDRTLSVSGSLTVNGGGTITAGSIDPFANVDGSLTLDGITIASESVDTFFDLLNKFISDDDITITNCTFNSAAGQLTMSKSDSTTTLTLNAAFDMNSNQITIPAGKTLTIVVPSGVMLTLPTSTQTVGGTLIIEGAGTVTYSGGSPFGGSVQFSGVTIRAQSSALVATFLDYLISTDSITAESCVLSSATYNYGSLTKTGTVTTLTVNGTTNFDVAGEEIDIPAGKTFNISVSEGAELALVYDSAALANFNISGAMKISGAGTVNMSINDEIPDGLFNVTGSGSLNFEDITIDVYSVRPLDTAIEWRDKLTCTNCTFFSEGYTGITCNISNGTVELGGDKTINTASADPITYVSDLIGKVSCTGCTFVGSNGTSVVCDIGANGATIVSGNVNTGVDEPLKYITETVVGKLTVTSCTFSSSMTCSINGKVITMQSDYTNELVVYIHSDVTIDLNNNELNVNTLLLYADLTITGTGTFECKVSNGDGILTDNSTPAN